jgi:hypothetical protein
MKKLLAIVLALCAPWPLAAQNAITQEGTVLQNSSMMFRGNNRARQGAPVGGAPTGQIVTTGDAVVGGKCDYSLPIDAADGYYFICFDAKNNAIRAGGTKLPAQNITIEINGTRYTFLGEVALVGSDAVVGFNTGLKTAAGAAGKRLVRLGFSAPGDGGLATYNWSDANCIAADDGAQVQPTGITGCWIADFSGVMPVPEVWGAKGDGIANDAAAVNAGLTYVAGKGGKLYARNGSTYGVSSTINMKDDTCFIGAGMDRSQIKLLDGVVSPVINMPHHSCLRDIWIDASPQTSGTVIKMVADYRASLDRVYTFKGCLAVDVSGGAHSISNSFFYEMYNSPDCGGIRVGHNTTNGTTGDLRITNTTIACNMETRAGFNMLFEDAGGTFIGPGVDNIGCTNGTVMKPGASQIVEFTFCNSSAIGDSNTGSGLLIDTASPSGKVMANSFSQCWTSGQVAPAGNGIQIQNTGGGKITGNVFIGHHVYGAFFNGVLLAKPVSGTIEGITFNGLRVCDVQTGADLLIGDGLAVTIQNSKIEKACDGVVSGNTTGLLYGIGLGANVQLFATGNDLTYYGTESWTAIAGIPTNRSVVANNSTVDNGSGPTYASASTVTLDQVTPRIHLSGTTTVNTITPAWNGQTLCIISDNGVVNFGTSGNIKAAVATSGAGGMVCGYYDPTNSKWYLH